MATISIKDLENENYNSLSNEVSYLQDLTHNEVNAIQGGAFWVAVVGAAWLGYSIAKEAKTNWFK
ncbi:hypothetical protein [Okeania sp. SIO2B9]|uniref:hypothetical protein n=1 Tax=Okeania sp. SIO2B9 TaxID=2607782 RepID=UPI0014296938|nr:hypothetical protein [Okeania sp. SIO2B9]NES91860.1 hypothetical protein [Okeania sp. SIO2B9]